MNTRRVVVPDLGDAVIEVVSDLTEMLIALVDETLESELPSVLADGFGLEALDRIWVLLKPTQERTAPRLFAPEWRAEYLRLSVVELDTADLATMGRRVGDTGIEPVTSEGSGGQGCAQAHRLAVVELGMRGPVGVVDVGLVPVVAEGAHRRFDGDE
jgi:hypothetical protein